MKHHFTLPVLFADYDVRLTVHPPIVDGKPANGSFDPDARRIRVHYDVTNHEMVRATIWHEFFHAVFRELGRSTLDDDYELADNLANAVMRVRLTHPWL